MRYGILDFRMKYNRIRGKRGLLLNVLFVLLAPGYAMCYGLHKVPFEHQIRQGKWQGCRLVSSHGGKQVLHDKTGRGEYGGYSSD